MSAKLSVGAAVNEAFRFGMKRWPSILRFFWLPTLIGAGIFLVIAAALIDFPAIQAAEGAKPGFEALKSALRVPFPIFATVMVAAYAVMFLLFSGGVASIYRLVVHGEERPGIVQLRFDGPAIRVFLSLFILGVINFAIFGVALLIAGAVTGQSPFVSIGAFVDFFAATAKAGPGGQVPTEDVTKFMDAARPFGIAMLYSLIPLLYLGVKLSPFSAASAAEDRLLLFGTFRMTFGHWWSIFFCYVLMTVAILLLAIVVELSFQIITGLSVALTAQGGAVAAVGGIITLIAGLAYFVYQMFIVAVQLALQASIYRRIAYGD